MAKKSKTLSNRNRILYSTGMKWLVLLLFASTLTFAQEDFPLGDGMEKWGVPLQIPNSPLNLRLGARFQSLATIGPDEQDFQARRVRFQFEASFPNKILYYMDIRNDNANEDDKGERNFSIGDAYISVPMLDTETNKLSFRLYRAKVDVARTETVSSAEILFVNRPKVADEAAQFVSHNRRASNVQLLGQFKKFLTYQIVAGDGVYSGRFIDAKSQSITKIEKQNFMVGGKLRFSLIPGWEDWRPTETYFGKGKHFSFGVGHFNTSKIETLNTNGSVNQVSRNLTNVELSAHYKEWSFFSEYFHFDGVIEDHKSSIFNKGRGEGYYVQGEKIFRNFHFIAPFARFESWDRFQGSGDYLSRDEIFGINWYANGNRFKLSLAYERSWNGADTTLDEDSESYHLATAWHF